MSRLKFEGDDATLSWLDSQKPKTRKFYASQWNKFLQYIGKIGNEILAERKADTTHEWENKVQAFKQELLNRELSEYTATSAAMTVRSFFAFHYCPLVFRKQETRRLAQRARKTEDYRFTKDEIAKMSEVADLPEKYVILGGKSLGLRAGDFARITRGDLEPFLKREVPICIGPLNTQKESVKAYPFIDIDALPIITAMIDKMTREGRTDPKERILTYQHEKELSRVIRRLAVKAGVDFGNRRVRFHCLRKFLCDHLASHMSESKWKQIVGKQISEAAYISPDELRKDYARAMTETSIRGSTAESDVEARIKKALLIEKAKELGWNEEQIQEAFRRCDLEGFEAELKAAKFGKDSNCEDGLHCQRMVCEEELPRLLSEGWKVKAVLPSGKVVIDNEH